MVWSQYVYEASVGLDVDTDSGGDDDPSEHDVGLNICEWEIQYSEELWELWDLLKMLIRDAFLDHVLVTHDRCAYDDFVEFCYYAHHDDERPKYSGPYMSNILYIWHIMWNEMKYLDFAPGATFDAFAYWVSAHSEINNLVV